MKNKELYTDSLLSFVLKIASKDYSSKSRRELETQVRKMLGSRKLVLAVSFYNVSTLLDLDIDAFSERFFGNYKFKKLDLTPTSDNRLKDFLTPYTRDVKEISTAANIENTRLSRLLSGEFAHLYPSEVYGLAKAFGLNPSQLFDFFYGKGPRPVVGV